MLLILCFRVTLGSSRCLIHAVYDILVIYNMYVMSCELQESPVTDRRADVVQAAYLASEIAHRMVVPGGEVCVDT